MASPVCVVRTAIVAAALTLLIPAPAVADVRDFIGRTLTDVRVEVGGAASTDVSVLQLIETRVGEALSMQRVRESVDHLVGVGRFEDVRVFASASAPPADGVTLRWVLVPVQRIASVEIEGRAAFSANDIRTEIVELAGALPVTARVDEIVEGLTGFYAERGYRRASIEPRLVPSRAPELVTLRLGIEAGPRTVIGHVTIHGDTGLTPAAVIDELRLERGRAYDRPSIDARVSRFADSLRDLGYYEANVDLSVAFADETGTADLTVNAERGPRVRVVFAGDPLPENRRNALVPIRQERSVDLDLLEDASRNIEAFLRQQGYRTAEAPYVREEKNGELVLTFDVRRGPLHRLASLDVTGNVALPRSALAPLLALEPGEPFSDSRVATVAAAITELYRVRGFARVAVRPEVSPAAPEDDGAEVPLRVRLVVTEGLPTVVANVTIEGNVAIAGDRLRELLRLTEQRPYYRPQLDADRDEIERLYRNEGFRSVRADAEVAVQDDGEHVDVRWTIVEGPRAIVDRVLVSGNERTSAELIRREAVLTPGTPLGDDAVIETQRRLATLGLFRRVRIVELPHGDGVTRDVLIEVEEAPATTVAYGGGVEAGRRLRTGDQARVEERIDIAPRGFFQISRRNLWGKNRSVSLFTRVSLRPRDPGAESDPSDTGGYGFNEYRVVGTFREPRLLDRAGDLQLTAFIEQAIRSSFNFWRRGIRLDYGRRVGSNVTLTARYALDRTRLFDMHIEPEAQLPVDRLFPQVRLSTVTGSILRDSRDDVIDPTRGTTFGVDTTLALRSIGSEVGFAKTSWQGFVYRRLPGAVPWTLAAGARMGVAAGFARVLDDGTVVNDVPASERFFAGGDSTVRGFVLDRLGTSETVNDQGFPAGGGGLAVVNVELRTPYWKGLGGVGFLDAGNVFRRATDISVAEFRPAGGFGLRYRSPLGPLRFDLGFNLDRQLLPNGSRERGMVFHLSLGQAF
ncbi:MAG TPA: POTRA domain-containing protein [Vicinamibacterales bacterium]|nr:POTRA domain-containing protein [Vicinamibacterales bacterium]